MSKVVAGFCLAVCFGLALLGIHGIAQAQEQVKVRSADAVLVPAAEFYRIDDGVFALRPGMSVDLTDRKILLTFRADWQYSSRDTSRFYIVLNGDREAVRAGTRIDLKRDNETRSAVADKGSCFLDVVNFRAPKGAPPTATFRLSCI